jgi:hypothetical protein
MIINAYRLADRYKQDPMTFLQQPLSQINMHVYYTLKLIELQNAARARENEDE